MTLVSELIRGAEEGMLLVFLSTSLSELIRLLAMLSKLALGAVDGELLLVVVLALLSVSVLGAVHGEMLLAVLSEMTMGAVDGGLLMASLLTELGVTLLALMLGKAVLLVSLLLLSNLLSEFIRTTLQM